jgi:hypothetical protein
LAVPLLVLIPLLVIPLLVIPLLVIPLLVAADSPEPVSPPPPASLPVDCVALKSPSKDVQPIPNGRSANQAKGRTDVPSRILPLYGNPVLHSYRDADVAQGGHSSNRAEIDPP